MKPFSLSVKLLIRDDAGRYLLLRRSARSKANAGKWDFPGGKVDPGESFNLALCREVLEETGLDVIPERVAGCAQSATPSKKIAYLILEGRVSSGRIRLSREHDEFAWVEPRELPEIDLCPQFLEFARSFSPVPGLGHDWIS